MVGIHKLNIVTKYCKYVITLTRNITVITGDSGIGKTSIVKIIRDYRNTSGAVFASFQSDCNVVIPGSSFGEFIAAHSKTRNSIFIIDETARYITSTDFAEVVNSSPNYFLLISRKPLHCLSYSNKAILTLRTVKGKNGFETYSEELSPAALYYNDFQQLITEDSKSGRQFWKAVSIVHVRDLPDDDEGKSTLYEKAYSLSLKGMPCVIIADGAAIGSQFMSLTELVRMSKYVTLWLPESFEWLLLKSGIVWQKGVDEVLSHPEQYIKSEEFCSWERFFTWLVEGIMEDTNHPYSKSKLSDWYMSSYNIEKFKAAIPAALREKIRGVLT